MPATGPPGSLTGMLIRREVPADVDDIRAVHASAFATADAPDVTPVEAGLVDALRSSDAWLPRLSLVAAGAGGEIVGHVACTRAWVDGTDVLGLGPLGVVPVRQGQGVGGALMHAALGAADALDEPLVALLGHAGYYPRFGFRVAAEYGVTPPVARWAPNFMVRTLTAYNPSIRGEFAYSTPFEEL